MLGGYALRSDTTLSQISLAQALSHQLQVTMLLPLHSKPAKPALFQPPTPILPSYKALETGLYSRYG